MQGKSLAERVSKISPSSTLSLNARVRELVKQGEKIINLSVGEPDLPTPTVIKEEGIKAIKENFTRYTPPKGIPELIEAIREKFKKDNGVEYSQEEIMVTPGAKFALYLIFQAILNPGDEVIIPSPYWVTYPEQVKLARGIPVIIETDETHLPSLEKIEKAITSRTKAFILNSPNNPSGRVFPSSLIEKIAELCREKNLWLISDEIYERIIFTGKHISPASLSQEIKEITFTVNGVSKTYSMTGWRLGYVGGPKEVIQAMIKIQSQSVSCVTSITQKAGLKGLTAGEEDVKKMVEEFRIRKNYLEKALPELGFEISPIEGTFYTFPRFSWKKEDSKEFSLYLLEKAKVAVVPGIAFGKEGYVRISFATSLDNLKTAIERIKSALK